MNIPDKTKPFKPWDNLILHLHPRKLRASTLEFTLTFGLGGMAALLVVIQVFTGLLLKFSYIPSPNGAYDSILNINQQLLFGKLAHNIHHWSSIFLLIIVFLHLLRVVFTGAYRPPRHASWIFGILLLLLVIFSNFTGYLLPWDQLSFWAVTVITSLFQYIPLIGEPIKSLLIGGNEVGAETLSNFYNLHTGIIPLLMVLFMAYHFWRVRRAGGVIVAEADKSGPVVETQPHLVARELVVALALVAFLLLFSVLFDAPLRERASPTISPNPAKAPWYFMGLQELLIHFHPFFAVVVFPLVLLTGSLYLPFLRLNEFNQGTWFLSEKGKRSAIHAAITGGIFTLFFILFSEILPDPQTMLPVVPSLITTGLIPFLIVVATIWWYLKYFKRKFGLTRSEIVQTLIVLLVVSYLVLSIIGMLFRVEGMELGW